MSGTEASGIRGVELLLDIVRDAGDGFTLEVPLTVGAAASAVGLATGPDRSRRLAPTDLQVRRADLVVVLDVGPLDAVWFGRTVIVPDTVAGSARRSCRTLTVTGLTAVPTGWTVI